MSERSVKCPVCPFSFCSLIDAGDFRAYVCRSCGWTQPTTDTRPGNRPADVCGLCDRPIVMTITRGDPPYQATVPNYGSTGAHRYIGPGMVHGGGRENIPIHSFCGQLDHIYDDDSYLHNENWASAFNYFREQVG